MARFRIRAATRTGALLSACLAEPERRVDDERVRALLARCERTDVLDAARYHRAIGYVHARIKDLEGADPLLVEQLGGLFKQAIVARLRVLGALKQVKEAIDPLGVDWLVVKGPVLDELVYPRPGLRLYHDLDLLVPRSAFADIVAALERAGLTLVDRNWDLLRRYAIGELVLSGANGPEVDVHWDLRYDRDVRRALSIDNDALAARARTVSVAGAEVRTLDPTDTLLHVAMHACKQGGDRLIWLKDIERTIAVDAPDWDAVVGRAQEWGVSLLVGSMLARTRHALGADVPGGVLRELLPSRAWRGMLASLDALFPPQRARGFGSPATLVVRATRRDARTTLANTGRGLAHRVRRLGATGRVTRDVEQDDPDSPASRAFPTGAPGSRELYLEELLREP